MQYLHTMVRISDIDESLDFYCTKLGMTEVRRIENEGGRFTLVFMAPPGQPECPVELTYNWDGDAGLPSDSRHFGHLAYEVDDIHATCARVRELGGHAAMPAESPSGLSAVVADDQGVSFSLWQPAPGY